MLLSKAVSRYARTAGTKHAFVRPARLSLAPCIALKVSPALSSTARPLRATSAEAASTDAEEDENGMAPCAPAFVVADNSHPHYTQFSIDVSRSVAIMHTHHVHKQLCCCYCCVCMLLPALP